MTTTTAQEEEPEQKTARRLRLAAVIPWRDLGKWAWGYLPADQYDAELIFAAAERRAPGYAGRTFPRYWNEFIHLARRRPNLNKYDVVFTWELRTTVAVGIWRRLTGQRRARWVVLDPIFRQEVMWALPILRWLLADSDRIACFSSSECDLYAKMLNLPRRQFLFVPLAWLENLAEATEDDGYLLALGQSNRDYPLLLDALEGTAIPATIVSGSSGWVGKRKPSEYVTLRYNLGGIEAEKLIAEATMHVIPLVPTEVSSGQSVLLRAMAIGKAVIVSDVPGVRDYVRGGETAILVPPSDAGALRAAIERLWNDPEERRRIGNNAARAVRDEFGLGRFARRLADIAEELTGRAAEPNATH